MSPTGGVKTVTSFRQQTIPGWDYDRKGTIEVNITVRAYLCNLLVHREAYTVANT